MFLRVGDWCRVFTLDHVHVIVATCKILNAYSNFVAFYRGDLYTEGLICILTAWSMYQGIFNRKQKLKMIL